MGPCQFPHVHSDLQNSRMQAAGGVKEVSLREKKVIEEYFPKSTPTYNAGFWFLNLSKTSTTKPQSHQSLYLFIMETENGSLGIKPNAGHLQLRQEHGR